MGKHYGNPVAGCDYHHLLFQKVHYKQGFAKLLRDHPYLGVYIPKNTLHRAIHSKIHDVPTPNGKECRLAFESITALYNAGLISLEDSPEVRLNLLINLWKPYCPATVAILEWQRNVITKFYGRD